MAGSRALWMIAGIILSLGATAMAAAAERARDELTIGVLTTTGVLHPNDTRGTAAFMIALGHRHISGPDQSWRVACILCVNLPSIANGEAVIVDQGDGERGMQVTFALLPGLAWADGVPVTSDDVVFSWKLGRTPGIGFRNIEIFKHITDVTKLDDHRFILHLDRVTYQYATPYFFEILPEHIEGPIIHALANKGDYMARSAYNTAPTTPGLWDGPYAMIAYEAGHRALFERNRFWPGPTPFFRRVTILEYPTVEALAAAQIAGEIDMLEEIYIPPERAHDIADHAADGTEVKSLSTSRFLNMTMNFDRQPFGDRRVRQALLMAADRDAIIQTILGDRRPAAHSFLNPRDPGYSPNPRRWPHAPQEARRLLLEAGYKPGADGMLANADGTALGFELMHVSENDLSALYGRALIAQWREFGISVTDRVDKTLFSDRLPRRDFDAALLTWNSVPEFSFEPMLSSIQIPSAANNFTGYNFSGYRNPRMDALLGALLSELDPARRAPIWSDIQALYAEDLPSLPLFNLPSTYVLPRWLTGYTPTGHYVVSSTFIEHWGRKPGS